MTAKKRDDRVRNSVWRARGFEHECCYDILRSRIFKLQKISIFFFLLLLLFVVYALNETYSNPRGSFKYDNRERVDRFNFRFRAERGIHRCFFFFLWICIRKLYRKKCSDPQFVSDTESHLVDDNLRRFSRFSHKHTTRNKVPKYHKKKNSLFLRHFETTMVIKSRNTWPPRIGANEFPKTFFLSSDYLCQFEVFNLYEKKAD